MIAWVSHSEPLLQQATGINYDQTFYVKAKQEQFCAATFSCIKNTSAVRDNLGCFCRGIFIIHTV